MEFEQVLGILRDIPDYQAFLTVDELNASTRALAARHPEIVQIIPGGKSRNGVSIEALKIGDGPHKALVYAMPHPNEPIGSMMIEYLAARLAEDDALRHELGYTWYLIKCIDPDGTRLNEGWLKGPFSIENYARHYYRPPSYQQVDWTFPIDYKTLHFHDPMPETRVLMDLIERVRPDFVTSLHNSDFGGVYFYITEDAREVIQPLHSLAKAQGIPLHLGEPEAPWAPVYAPAIFGVPSVADGYDFLLAQTGQDPAATMQQGTSSLEFARLYCDPFAVVCEVPYFYNPAIHDTTPSRTLRRDAIVQGVEHSRAAYTTLQQILDSVRTELTVRSPFRESIEFNLRSALPQLAAEERWAQTDPHMSSLATVAEEFDSRLARRFHELLSAGMMVRLVDAQIEATGKAPGLIAAKRKAEAAFGDTSARLRSELTYTVIPIRRQVSMQLGATLVAAEYARRRHPAATQ